MSDLFVQCQLASGDSRLVAWLEFDRRLRQGCWVRLKDAEDPKRWWTVVAIGQPRQRESIKRGWKNDI